MKESGEYKPKEIKVTNIPRGVHEQLKAISKNTGVDMASIVKAGLPNIIVSYPESMRRVKPDLEA